MSLPYLQPYLGLSNGLNTLHAAGGGGGAVGGWKELGRTTLGSTGDDMVVSGITSKRYYMVLANLAPLTHDVTIYSRLGDSVVDTGSNYSSRSYDPSLGYDSTYTSRTNMVMHTGAGTTNVSGFEVGYIANYVTKEKLWINHTVNNSSNGAGNAPHRSEGVSKWANTSNEARIISYNNYGSGSFEPGCELIVLGYDPLDTETGGFWQELASVELGGTADEISSGTISAKKYLWVQAWFKASGDTNQAVQFNNDTSGNYANRGSYDGGADGTSTSSAYAIANYGSAMNTSCFMNMFIINNASTEKLVICHIVDQEASGAGTAPHRQEQVGKWANTSNQITEIDIKNTDTGDYAAGSLLKVWGAD